MPGVSALAAGDINGDGDAEIFAASATLNRISTYENLGARSRHGPCLGARVQRHQW